MRKYNQIKVSKNVLDTTIYTDYGLVFRVPGYQISIGNINIKGGGTSIVISDLTLDDLKELRRVIRKCIRNEDNQ